MSSRGAQLELGARSATQSTGAHPQPHAEAGLFGTDGFSGGGPCEGVGGDILAAEVSREEKEKRGFCPTIEGRR
jgi:hypothetical protein